MLRPGWQAILLVCAGLGAVAAASDRDWPTWRHDPGRTGASSLELARELNLQWRRELPAPRPAFPHDPRVCFDLSYEPIAVGKRLLVPSMVTDSVAAYDTDTGREVWTFFADAPVRLAPVGERGRVYFVSDDGCLYCVRADDGRLVWRFSGVPAERAGYKLLGNERLVSRWPARGGPVLVDGTVYFTAGIWPNEGVFIYAVDAATGRLVWENHEAGFLKDSQLDHGTRRDGGLVPQGYLAVLGSRLIVPCGRALPAFFDRRTGRMEPYTSGWGGRVALAKGSWWVCGQGDFLFQSGDLYALGRPDVDMAKSGKGEKLVPLADFAEQMKLSPSEAEKCVREFGLDVVEKSGQRVVRVRGGSPVTYLSWWTSSKREPPRAGEQRALESRCRLQVDPANTKELGVFREPVLADGTVYYSSAEQKLSRRIRDEDREPPTSPEYAEIVASGLPRPEAWTFTYQGGWGTPHRLVQWPVLPGTPKWDLASKLKVHIKSGSRLYAGASGVVAAIGIPASGQEPAVAWQAGIEGTPSRMLAADDKLFVLTREGSLYAFGKPAASPELYSAAHRGGREQSDGWTVRARQILDQTGIREGYCLALGLGSGRLVEELARQSALQVIVVETDREQVARSRQRFHAMGLYGDRVHVVPGAAAGEGTVRGLRLPPYLANLIVCEDPQSPGLSEAASDPQRLFALLRPYGGVACLPIPVERHAELLGRLGELKLAGAELARHGDSTYLARPGALPDSADWTHENGDAGQTYASSDRRVKPPFGVLWFGGGVDREIACLKGPAPRVAGGRMFMQVGGELHAADIYTGRHLWNRSLNRLNDFAAIDDQLYVVSAGACLRLDPATGEPKGTIAVPATPGKEKNLAWRQIRILGDRLVGTAGKYLVCADRHSGQPRWQFAGRRDGLGFALGGDKVFAIDWWLPVHRRRGDAGTEQATIYALDLSNGRVLWERNSATPAFDPPSKREELPSIVNPQVAYSEAADVVVFTRNKSTAAAYRGASGELLWSREIPCKDPPQAYTSAQPPIVLADVLVTHGGEVIELASGRSRARMWNGMNQQLRGCGRALGSPNMITVRDGNLSYFDLSSGEHGYIRGVRSGCTNSLIPADGLLCAPNYARHCTCNWPMSVSLALVPMPEAPNWDPAVR